jgi:hypothetical protein
MEIAYGKVFNLMDTNGRRSDVINALYLYLNILNEEQESSQNYEWSNFPKSLNQYKFYKRCIEESPEIFLNHPQFDNFQEKYKAQIELFFSGNKSPLIGQISSDDKIILDVGIESRARHYSSNLVKLGFIGPDRKITPAGYMFLNKGIVRDKFESILPLTNTNISLIRQLMKLRIYSSNQNNTRTYYSPFLFAIYLLLTNNQISNTDFRFLIQSASPYSNKDPDKLIDDYFKNASEAPINVEYPFEFKNGRRLSLFSFKENFKNSKSSATVETYWKFYNVLYDFKLNNDQNYFALLSLFKNSTQADKLKKAFGFGKPIFDFSENSHFTDVKLFLEINKNNELLKTSIDNFNIVMLKRFTESKYFDMSIEYSDTTKRIFSATGLFKFEKGLSKLAYKDLLSGFFDLKELRSSIFGSSTEEEFLSYEGNGKSNYYFSVQSTSEILKLDQFKSDIVIRQIEKKFGTSISNIANITRDLANKDFVDHISKKYPKNKVLELLRLFEDRNNDFLLKEYVNPEATVPTIYEYLVGIAWYYLAEEKINVYDSLNLTLNADFEPVLHASGGDGDIVIKEENRVTMLEVTLMNRSSQGRAEMEPVLRHSNNLKAKYSPLETLTFFIACELDINTVNIWRYLLSKDQIATLNSSFVNGTMIMSFTNNEICKFIEQEITASQIIKITKDSFVSGETISGWRDKIVNSLFS